MTMRKKRLLQGVVPRGSRRQNGSLSEASKSPFRAKAPAEELLSTLNRKLVKAREELARQKRNPWQPPLGYYVGKVDALEELQQDIERIEGKQALARNE